jgi:hypothetical protein
MWFTSGADRHRQQRLSPTAETRIRKQESAMKIIVSTLIALSVLAGIAAVPASAAEFNSEKFWTQQDREHY